MSRVPLLSSDQPCPDCTSRPTTLPTEKYNLQIQTHVVVKTLQCRKELQFQWSLVSFQVHFTHRQLCQSGHYGSDSIGSECDPLEATCNVGVHFGWILYWSAVQGRNWQGRGSGYFRIRRLSGLDALPSHHTHHHPHHHFCCPHHHHHQHHGAHQFLFSRSAPTLEYGQPVQV